MTGPKQPAAAVPAADAAQRAAGRGAVDPTVLDKLTTRLGERGPGFRATLLQTWRDETQTRLGELAAAAGAGDGDGVARVAHTMKSSSAALGAGELAAVCEHIEDRLRAGDDRDLHADADAISQHVARASAAFAALWEPVS
jgi:HPt (histidine-containing phosphotransfer) domain-containing protein